MLSKTQVLNRKPMVRRPFYHLNAAMRACAAWAAIEEHDKILDMACEDGALLGKMGENCRLNRCGLCDSPEKARIAREVLQDADVIPGRMDDIPWRDSTFDIVMLPAPIKGDARRVMEEAFRVLRGGGQMTVASPVLEILQENELNRREMMRLMQEAGFKEVSFRASGLYGVISGWKRREMI